MGFVIYHSLLKNKTIIVRKGFGLFFFVLFSVMIVCTIEKNIDCDPYGGWNFTFKCN